MGLDELSWGDERMEGIERECDPYLRTLGHASIQGSKQEQKWDQKLKGCIHQLENFLLKL